MTNLSIIVITRNRLVQLQRCLGSIWSTFPNAEIIVVDNGSDDGTVKYLKNCQNLKIKLLNSNKGVAGARNIGISLATKDFIMWIDDDAWIQSLSFDPIEKYFASNPDIGIIAPRLLYPNGKIQESVRSFPTLSALIWRGFNLHKIFSKVSWYKNYVVNNVTNHCKIDWSIGACQIIRRNLFQIIGNLDEGYFFGYEDADFCLRAKRKGFQTIFWREAVVYHEYARTSAKGINIFLFRHIISICRFFIKKFSYLFPNNAIITK